MPRLSSPLNAKASVRSPYALDRSQQNSCVGTVCPPAVRTAEETPTHALCALMSSRVCPPSFRGSRANPSIHNVSVQPGPRPGRKTCLLTIAIASGGARRDRTDDLMLAKHALSQLSYGPLFLSLRRRRRHPSPWLARHEARRHASPGRMAGLRTLCVRTEPHTDEPGSIWWAWEDLNLRPHAYQARALTN